MVRAHGTPGAPQTNAKKAPPVANPKKDATSKVIASDLNVIFYGPPGTGKTYTTIRAAVEIIDGAAPDERAQLVARYAELRDKGLIEFVTFHQSFSYEEFVEGIRPVFDSAEEGESDGVVRYECKAGVFRQLCTDTEQGTRKVSDTVFDPEENQVWKLSLGNTQKPEEAAVYEECIEGDYVLLGWGRGLDYAGCDTRDAIFDVLKKSRPDSKSSEFHVAAVHRFKNQMKEGDLIVVSEGNRRFRAIARVTGPYRRLRDAEYGQMRPVEWLLVLDESLPREQISNKIFSQASIYRLSEKNLRVDKLRELLSGDAEQRNRVLIIDEINRGNIAKILGELITLIEPDKRKGAPNELRVTLPYSGAEFSVPSNLFIIGTMNTADRSIALLDTALRRRFRFIEMAPDAAVIRSCVGDNGLLGGLDVAKLFSVLNDRIELLYDRDHRLGHAYFLSCKSLDDLRDVVVERVIPLLEEYFHEHWERICLVLGCAHDDNGKALATHPIVRARALSAAKLLGEHAECDDRHQYSVNPAFLTAKGEELRPFFEGLLKPTPTQEPP